MAWNRKGVTYVVTDAPCYQVTDDSMVADRYVGSEPMHGAHWTDFVFAASCASQDFRNSRVVSIFEETRTLHGGYMGRLLWQEVRDGF